MTRRNNWMGRASAAVLFAGVLGGCEFIESTTSDPNNVSDANVNQLFTGVQVNTFYMSQNFYARVASMWTNQTAGVNAQFNLLDQYTLLEDDTDDEMASHYGSGGLIDIRAGIELANEEGRRVYAGIFKIYEAYLIGMAADVYGDIPYSEAANPDFIAPGLDPQLDVYSDLQTLLDEAIQDLASGSGAGPGTVDLNFGGDVGCWTEVAYSLKARYYLHTAEVDPGAYAQALAAAGNGIDSNACSLEAVHSTAATETNVWHQFMRDRPAHITAGYFLTNVLNNGTPGNTADDDPRLAYFFDPATGAVAGQYVGSLPGSPTGDNDQNASPLDISATGVLAAGNDHPIVTCAETQFIVAEAQARAGNPVAARTAANAAIACEEDRHGLELAEIPVLVGDPLLDAILEEKYIALFLNYEVWNDYKRTCYPEVQTSDGDPIPGRLLYGATERATNPQTEENPRGIPDVGEQRQNPRNANDPQPCA
jgi:starch-binding outer membrane protein, SusD/RagB family